MADREHAGGANAERRIADLDLLPRRSAARRRVRSRASVRRLTHAAPANGSTASLPKRKAVAGFAEDLPGAAVVARGRVVEEAREHDVRLVSIVCHA